MARFAHTLSTLLSGGLPLDYGRMEPTVSNPDVYAQMGMRVGIPNAISEAGPRTSLLRASFVTARTR